MKFFHAEREIFANDVMVGGGVEEGVLKVIWKLFK